MIWRALFEYWHIIALGLAMIAWRVWGNRITGFVRRMDQQRARTELQAMYDRSNPNSHFRQSVEQINEDTPSVVPHPTDQGVCTWAGQSYASREDAEAARWHHVLNEARSFYRDLDRQFGNRIAGRDKSETIDGARD